MKQSSNKNNLRALLIESNQNIVNMNSSCKNGHTIQLNANTLGNENFVKYSKYQSKLLQSYQSGLRGLSAILNLLHKNPILTNKELDTISRRVKDIINAMMSICETNYYNALLIVIETQLDRLYKESDNRESGNNNSVNKDNDPISDAISRITSFIF